jgi:hypothetical protein
LFTPHAKRRRCGKPVTLPDNLGVRGGLRAGARPTMSVLGEIKIVRGGKEFVLPASRKARALVIYLATTGRPHRRDRLCTVRRLAATPEKAHTREAPRTSTTNGMPTAMLAHIPSVAQGRTRMP